MSDQEQTDICMSNFLFPLHRSEVLRLGVGNFLEDIHNKMQSKISGER